MVRRGAFALATLAAVSSSRAGNWEYQPRVELSGIYNDNYRLAEQGQEKLSVYGTALDAQLALRDVGPRSDIAFVPRLHANYLPNDTTDQSTDGFLDVIGNYRTIKSLSSFTLQLADESVFSSEILPANFPGIGLGQAVNGTSGRLNVRNRRRLAHLEPSFQYDWGPRRKLHLDLDYLRAQYEKTLLDQAGYRSLYAAVGVEFVLSPRSSFTVRGIGSRFEPDGLNNNTNRYGLEAEWDQQRTQVMQTYVRVGVNRTEARTAAAGSISNTGATGGAGVRWNYQITQVTLDVLRSLVPSSAGAVVTSNELRFRVKRVFQPRFWGFAALRGVQVRGAEQAVAFVQSRDYVAAQLGLVWRMSRDFRLTGTYDYTWQRFAGEPRAYSDGALISVVYQPESRFEPIHNTLIPPD